MKTSSGFSDTVRLGNIGTIKENDEVVMRVRVENRDLLKGSLHWRGVALDTFDKRSWSKSQGSVREAMPKGDREIIQLDYPSGREPLVSQTVYLEPLDSPVLFSLPRVIAVQSTFQMLFRDVNQSVSFPRVGERSTYKTLSDVSQPSEAELRADEVRNPRSVGNYLQLPEGIDPRIAALTQQVTVKARNRYDAAES